jgi:hypothetical protein
MILALSALLAAVSQPGDRNEDVIVLRHDISPGYNRTDYESPCGSAVFRVRFQNGPDRHGRVEHVTIDGRPVPGAAVWLQVRAAQRVIGSIHIMNCGLDQRRPVFSGRMELSPLESQRLKMSPTVYFSLRRQEQGEWQMVLD